MDVIAAQSASADLRAARARLVLANAVLVAASARTRGACVVRNARVSTALVVRHLRCCSIRMRSRAWAVADCLWHNWSAVGQLASQLCYTPACCTLSCNLCVQAFLIITCSLPPASLQWLTLWIPVVNSNHSYCTTWQKACEVTSRLGSINCTSCKVNKLTL